MSILVKDMKMPKSCDMCWALDDYGDYPRCRITEEQRGYNFQIREKRMDKCPLVPVPPHGRLIDADALYNVFLGLAQDEWNRNTNCTWGAGFAEAMEITEDAPTIIQTEEGE